MFFTSLSVLGLIPLALGKVRYMGMNIAGGDFGCAIDGTCPISSSQLPLTTLGGGDGLGQMQHFVADDQMNIFRLPVSWQFLVNNQLGATLDTTNLAKYDKLIQACLSLTSTILCAIDIHNFARWNTQIIGQSSGAVTNAHFTSLWAQLATKYAATPNLVFGICNEPHDLDIALWTATVQEVVTAIRNAGASSQMILLPGTNFASAGQFVSSGSADALKAVVNPDGTTTGLVFDLHKYLDVDNSGTHATCTTDNVADAFQIAGDWLRASGRQALVSETGAGSDSTCFTDFCAQNAFLNANSDVYLGYIAWAAGSFSTSYLLSLTPTKTNGKYVDNALASQCVVGVWLSASTASASSVAAVVSSTAAAGTAVGSAATGTITLSKTSTSTRTRVVGGGKTITTSLVSSASGVESGSLTQTTLALATNVANSTAKGNLSATASATGSGAASTQVISTGGVGEGMRRYAGGLLIGSLAIAVLL